MAAKQLGIDADRRRLGGSVVPCCGNSCGLFGTARTKNLCARCYRDHLNAVDKAAEAERARALLASFAGSCLGAVAAAAVAAGPEMEKKKKKAASTCSSCRRKVGLLGFAQGCGFDFKRADRERISDENTVVVAPNIAKICHSNY